MQFILAQWKVQFACWKVLEKNHSDWGDYLKHLGSLMYKNALKLNLIVRHQCYDALSLTLTCPHLNITFHTEGSQNAGRYHKRMSIWRPWKSQVKSWTIFFIRVWKKIPYPVLRRVRVHIRTRTWLECISLVSSSMRSEETTPRPQWVLLWSGLLRRPSSIILHSILRARGLGSVTETVILVVHAVRAGVLCLFFPVILEREGRAREN
jgi:hypothetical protein